MELTLCGLAKAKGPGQAALHTRMMPAPDPEHWLYRLAPREWLRASLRELAQAERAFAGRDRRAGLAGCRRAAGMSLNGPLRTQLEPDPTYGRSYLDHLRALGRDEGAPEAVRQAVERLLGQLPEGPPLVLLRRSAAEEPLVEDARTIMAHAYALVLRAEPAESVDEGADSAPTEPGEGEG